VSAFDLIILLLVLPALGRVWWRQQRNERNIMNLQEAVQALTDDSAQKTKALGEIRGLVDTLNIKIKALEDAAQNQEIPVALADAIAATRTISQQLDDVVPDAPPAA
jgi:predicted  nucleic acid-binding Zn-ribbon protein